MREFVRRLRLKELMDHFQIVATGFRVAGLLIGIPSLCAALFFGITLVQMPGAVPVPGPSPGESQSLITVLMTGARLLGRVAGFLTELSRVVIAAMFALTSFLTVFSAGLYYTGRGLAAHQAWARITAMTMAFLLAAVWLIGLMPMKWGPISLAVLGASCYTLWVLFRMA